MKQRRGIYALLLAVIYITATSLSSISLLTCDHHHHHHHQTECCKSDCHCNHTTLSAKCCDHEHPILGEHHTDYIVSNQRGDSSSSQALAILLTPTLIAEQFNYEAWYEHPSTLQQPGDEAVPLVAAIQQTKTLRAPPALV
jgi:hypothetical protein